MENNKYDNPNQEKRVPQHYRLQIRIIKMAQKRAAYLGLNMPTYISQLIVKDGEGGN